MLSLDQAIKTVYANAGLTSSVGQIFDNQQPEGSVLPYVSFKNQSDNRWKGTQVNVYQQAKVSFTVWGTQKDTVLALAELIENVFKNCNTHAANRSLLNFVVYFRLDVPYVADQVSDTIWNAMQSFTVLYRKSNPIPA